ncbi:hypothetical protein KP509_30G047000 [Ceratopteris richardii]|uniref:Non-specific lipid-transfer protein n=1 Tax=Ceratopteris richardii TaxID=49495 RepID=A0A8T2R3N5_CERRI|nr:hypothetical protein KP509_30G047000 [Ceratopteris richardii]
MSPTTHKLKGSSVKGVVVSVWFAACLLTMLSAMGDAVISCSTVQNDLMACAFYVIFGGSPSGSCCSAVQSLYWTTASSRSDRIAACHCIKSLLSSLGSSVDPSRVAALPRDCNVNLGYSVSININCASIP